MRILFKVTGSISVGFAFAGAILPVLPTTPFVLLSFYLFDKSDPKYREWLVQHPKLGPIIKEYLLDEGISRKAKIKALILLWSSILISVVFFISNPIGQIVSLLAAVCVSVYLLCKKTKRETL